MTIWEPRTRIATVEIHSNTLELSSWSPGRRARGYHLRWTTTNRRFSLLHGELHLPASAIPLCSIASGSVTSGTRNSRRVESPPVQRRRCGRCSSGCGRPADRLICQGAPNACLSPETDAEGCSGDACEGAFWGRVEYCCKWAQNGSCPVHCSDTLHGC